MKNYHYMLSRTCLVNGMSIEATIQKVTPWWMTALYAVDAVFAVLTLSFVVMLIRKKKSPAVIEIEAETKGEKQE